MKRKLIQLALILQGCALGTTALAEDHTGNYKEQLASANISLETVERSLKHYATRGDSKAQLALAKLYDSHADRHDDAKAVKWYTQAAKNGNAEAQFILGIMYLDGEVISDGVSDSELQDDSRYEGRYWIEMAASQGHYRAKILQKSLEIQDNSFGC